MMKFKSQKLYNKNFNYLFGNCLLDESFCQKTSSCNFYLTSALYSIVKPFIVHRKYIILSQTFLKKQVMQVQTSNNIQKRHYSRITLKIKVTLIRMVCRKGIPFDTAIQELGLKKTTALNIIKTYKETGSIPMRKFKKIRKTRREKSPVKTQEEELNSQPLEEQISPEAFSNDELPPQQYLAYYPFNFLWIGCPMAFYCSY